MWLIPSAFFGLGWFASCTELPCVDPKKAQVNIRFFSADTQEPDSIRFDTILVYSSSGAAILVPASAADSSDSQQIVPDPQSPAMLVVFRKARKSDSIYLRYHPEPAFHSDDCGYYYRYTGLKAEKAGTARFKTVSVVQPIVDSTSSATHVQVYF